MSANETAGEVKRIRRILRKLDLRGFHYAKNLIILAVQTLDKCSEQLYKRAIAGDTKAQDCMDMITRFYSKLLGSKHSTTCYNCYYNIDCGEYREYGKCKAQGDKANDSV